MTREQQEVVVEVLARLMEAIDGQNYVSRGARQVQQAIHDVITEIAEEARADTFDG